MRHISTTDLRQQLADVIDQLDQPERILIVTKHDIPRAALLSLDMVNRLFEALDLLNYGPFDPVADERVPWRKIFPHEPYVAKHETKAEVERRTLADWEAEEKRREAYLDATFDRLGKCLAVRGAPYIHKLKVSKYGL